MLPKTRFFGLHFYCRQSESIFNHSDITGHKATKFVKIMWNNGHYANQGHSRSQFSVPTNRKPVGDSLCVNNSNLHATLHHFWDIADYWSHFRCRRGCLCLTHSFRVNN